MQTLLRTNLIATGHGTHNHGYPQILIGQQGIMHCELPASSADMSRGSVGLLPRANEHRYQGASTQCQLLVIDLNAEDAFIKAFEESCHTSIESRLLQEPMLLSPTQGVLTLLDWADYQIRHVVTPALHVLQYQLISVFLAELMLQSSSGMQSTKKLDRLDKTRLDSYIDANLHRQVENDELADLCYVSTSHLYGLIKQISGLSPQRYIMTRRMIRAQELIREQKGNLATIAHRVGFSDGASFSRAFRRHFNHAPSALGAVSPRLLG
ncbi:AraC family transcriptional regulator [Pseudomonas sp.]|uniref:AraC family transcriptional regulator n=1 Tax=Pseudomonas sp. TaxID=306 RepID=UPI0028A6CDE7|nr:AraC family transcriptional regulator [Pseudomonas sp.]